MHITIKKKVVPIDFHFCSVLVLAEIMLVFLPCFGLFMLTLNDLFLWIGGIPFFLIWFLGAYFLVKESFDDLLNR